MNLEVRLRPWCIGTSSWHFLSLFCTGPQFWSQIQSTFVEILLPLTSSLWGGGLGKKGVFTLLTVFPYEQHFTCHPKEPLLCSQVLFPSHKNWPWLAPSLCFAGSRSWC